MEKKMQSQEENLRSAKERAIKFVNCMPKWVIEEVEQRRPRAQRTTAMKNVVTKESKKPH